MINNKKSFTLFRPIIFFGGGGASCDLKSHSRYNLKTAHATATRDTKNDVLIISNF